MTETKTATPPPQAKETAAGAPGKPGRVPLDGIKKLALPKDRGEYYERHLGPALLMLGEICERLGFSFVAAVETDTAVLGTTAVLQSDACYGIRSVNWAAQSAGNVDALIGAMVKHAKKHGHQSIYLSLLERAGEEHSNAKAG